MTTDLQERARHYLGPKLDPSALSALGTLDLCHPRAAAALLSALRRLAVAHQPAAVLTEYFVEQLAEQLQVLQGAVSAVSLPLRFVRLDRWVLGHVGRHPSEKPTRLMDIFPPTEPAQNTSTAERFTDLEVTAVTQNVDLEGSTDPQHLIRCMNVVTTLSPLKRARFLARLRATLLPNGHALIGVHSVAGSEARYQIFWNAELGLLPVAFAFSIDCLFPLGPRPFLELERDPDAARLMRLIRTVREDRKFAKAFDARFDHLLLKNGLIAKAPRNSAALLCPLAPAERAQALDRILSQLDEEGWVDRAASILASGGLPAFRNECGDVAVRLS